MSAPSPAIEPYWQDWHAYWERARQVYWNPKFPACRAPGGRHKARCLLPPDHDGPHYGNGYDVYGPQGPVTWERS